MVQFRSIALLALLVPALGMVIPQDDLLDADVNAKLGSLTRIDDLRKQTNADRFAKGLGPLPPTRRSTGLKARASGSPGASGGGGGGGGSGVSTQDVEDEDPNFGGPLAIRLRNPRDGSNLGVITLPTGDDNGDLVNFDPDTTRAQKFQFGQGSPFDIYPMDQDGAFWGGKTPLLGARPGKKNPSIAPGSPDFLHVGLAHPEDGLLNIRLPQNLLAHGPANGLLDGLVGDILPGDVLPGGDSPAQSTMWSFDPKTRKLIAHYLTPNGDRVPTYFVTGGACHHLICLTADVAAFRNVYGDDALELHALVTVL